MTNQWLSLRKVKPFHGLLFSREICFSSVVQTVIGNSEILYSGEVATTIVDYDYVFERVNSVLFRYDSNVYVYKSSVSGKFFTRNENFNFLPPISRSLLKFIGGVVLSNCNRMIRGTVTFSRKMRLMYIVFVIQFVQIFCKRVRFKNIHDCFLLIANEKL